MANKTRLSDIVFLLFLISLVGISILGMIANFDSHNLIPVLFPFIVFILGVYATLTVGLTNFKVTTLR